MYLFKKIEKLKKKNQTKATTIKKTQLQSPTKPLGALQTGVQVCPTEQKYPEEVCTEGTVITVNFPHPPIPPAA